MKRPGLLAIGPFSTNTLIVMVAVYVALFANTALFNSAFNIYKGGAEEILFASLAVAVHCGDFRRDPVRTVPPGRRETRPNNAFCF